MGRILRWIAVLLVALVSPVRADPVLARPADALVDSIGVNTHFGYDDRPYVSAFGRLKVKLAALGVRHIRDGNSNRKDVAARINELYRSHGIRVLQLVGPRIDSATPWLGKLDAGKIDRELDQIKSLFRESNEGIEGPNEYDLTHNHPQPQVNDPDWPATLRSYTEALQKKVGADPILKGRPVIGPSMAHAFNAPKAGDLSAFITFGNMHPYPGGWNPGRGLDDYNLPNTRKMTGDRVLWATETGYHNAMKQAPGGHFACPEGVAGKYGPRLVAEYFRRGFGRAYFYELVDEGTNLNEQEGNFGLLRHDLSEKPIYKSLQHTISLLKDPGPPFKPGKLDYTLAGDTKEIHQVLLEKRDGRFYLLLWQEVPSYDVPKRKEEQPAARPLTVNLAKPMRRATIFLPSSSGTRPVNRIDSPQLVKVAVPDQLLVIELTPKSPAR